MLSLGHNFIFGTVFSEEANKFQVFGELHYDCHARKKGQFKRLVFIANFGLVNPNKFRE